MTTPALPKFHTRTFLQEHAQFILDFYEPRVVDPNNGFYQCFKDDGEIYDKHTRHLVSSTRFVFNYATAYRLYGKDHHRDWALHGLDYLQSVHRQSNNNYAWEIHDGKVTDGRAMAYGHAFVMLCAASCIKAGIGNTANLISETWDFVEEHFWDAAHQAYADERDASLATLDHYRGQNANMHMCEALIAAWQATTEQRYLDRAKVLANRFAFELAEQSNGLIWEHYDANWHVDMQYNIDKPDDLFKPWGFQPGHQVEWTKLLLQLNDAAPEERYITKAAFLFDEAWRYGWDTEFGGLVYGFAPDKTFSDAHKYFWVHAEAFAAAWRLHKVTGKQHYLDCYNEAWKWSWNYLIDHRYGAWYRIRNRDGSEFDDLKSPPGKTDYHTLGAVWDVLDNH